MNSNLTEVVFILDRSGSMSKLVGDTIGIEFSEFSEREPGAVVSGIEEIRRPAPAFQGEVPESQNAALYHKTYEFLFITAHTSPDSENYSCYCSIYLHSCQVVCQF